MKRLTFILILFLSDSKAQEVSNSVGGTWNFVSIQTYHKVEMKSYSMSATIKNYYGKVVGFESGLIYTAFQYDVEYDYSHYLFVDTIHPVTNTVKAGYMEFPLLFHFRFINKSGWQVYSFGGIGISLLVNAHAKTIFNNGVEGSLSSHENSIGALQFGLGSYYKINERIAFGIKSAYKEYLEGFSSLTNDHPSIILAGVEINYLW